MPVARNKPETGPRQNRRAHRDERLIWAGLWALALGLRATYLWQIREAPMLSVLMGDARGYDDWARQIAAGHWLGQEVFYQAPLYPYFLALIYATLGRDLYLVRAVQAILGATSCVFIARAGRDFFDRRVGIVAGVLLAVYPSAIYFDGLIQKPVLDVFFLSLLLCVLGRCTQTPRPGWWFLAGTLAGILTLSRENALVLLPVIAAWVWLAFQRETQTHRLRWIGALALGAGLVLLPVGVRNRMVGGEFHLTTSQFGPNFYIGNNPQADGRYAPLRFGRGDPQFEREDATQLAEAALGRKLSPAEVSRYWTGRALDYIRSDFAGWRRLMARKWALVWNVIELPDTEDVYTYGEYSTLLNGLTRRFHFGVLCPLAALGVVVTWPMRQRLWLLYVMLLSYAGSVAMFYVFGRYRFPLVAWLVMFAAAGLVETGRLARAKRLARVFVGAALAVVVAVLVNQTGACTEDDCRSNAHSILAHHLAQQPGKTDEAMAHYRRALELRPQNAGAHYSFGVFLAGQGQLDEAIAHFNEALRLKPDFARAHNNLGAALASQGRLAEANRHFERALQISPDYAEARYNHAKALLALGRAREAVQEYRETLRLNPDLPAALRDLAWVLATHPDAGIRDGAEAARLAERLRASVPAASVDGWDVLAAAYAEVGRFDDAIETAQQALRLARAAGQQTLAGQIAARLEGYRSGRPFREDAPPLPPSR